LLLAAVGTRIEHVRVVPVQRPAQRVKPYGPVSPAVRSRRPGNVKHCGRSSHSRTLGTNTEHWPEYVPAASREHVTSLKSFTVPLTVPVPSATLPGGLRQSTLRGSGRLDGSGRVVCAPRCTSMSDGRASSSNSACW
jgi:hypothetical protein